MVEPVPSWPYWVRNNIAGWWSRPGRPRRGGAKPVWRAYGRIAAGTVVAIVLLLLTRVCFDVAAIRVAMQSPPWLLHLFAVVTQFGLSGWFLYPLGIAMLLLAFTASPSLSRMTRLVIASVSMRLTFLFMAVAIPGLVVTVVKRLIGRARPLYSNEDPFLYQFLGWRADHASLPSGHATTAFAVAIAFGVLWPRLRPLLWSYAVAVALSRVMLAAHHPSDVIAGAIAGAVGALLVRDWLAARRLGFIVCADGRVVPMPGPSFARIKRVARSLAGQ
jgi:undecaprenyl-diphosphatase